MAKAIFESADSEFSIDQVMTLFVKRWRLAIVHSLLLLSFCVGTKASDAVAADTIADNLDISKVELFPRWQFEPKFDFTWMYRSVPVPLVADVEALSSPVVSERIAEARRIVLISEQGEIVSGDSALAVLMRSLESPPSDRLELLAYMSAAMILGDQSIAPQLWSVAQADAVAQSAVEKWLIEIGSKEAVGAWRTRLAQSTRQDEDLLSAIEGIGNLGEPSDAAELERILWSESSRIPTRLTVAKALGQLVESGLEPSARKLLGSKMPLREFFAAHILARHTSSAAGDIAEEILALESSAAHSIALRNLIQVDVERARKAIDNGLLQHADSSVRLIAVQHLSNLNDASALSRQGFALRDTNSTIRRTVRANMQRKYEDSAGDREFIQKAIGFYLSGDHPMGAEQAIVLSVALKQKQFCPQLVNLLEHPDERVNVRAAWGLQELADQPDVLAAMVPMAQKITGELEILNNPVAESRVTLLSMLFGAFGRNAYEPVNDMLLKYIPKNQHIMRDQARASAIWALGHIWTQRSNPSLAKQLAGRMLDESISDPEAEIVKYASVLALGMIRDPASPERLSLQVEEVPLPLGYATDWARQQFENN